MNAIREGQIEWTFDAAWSATKYDDWAFYRRQYQSCAGGPKAVDILALSGDDSTLWMIEAKDYRRNRREAGKGSLPQEVAQKAHDTLAGVLAAAMNAVDDEKAFARRAVGAGKVRVVLHLEQPRRPSKLFPVAFDPADVRQQLKRLVRAIDAHPVVMATTSTWPYWATTWAPR